MRLLALAVLISLSCATAPKPVTATFVDDSQGTADAWVCLPKDNDRGQLLCMDVREFISHVQKTQSRGTSEL